MELVWYAFSRLSGAAAGRLHPWMEVLDGRPNFCVEKFLLQLDLAFGDPRQTKKAVDRLNTI